MARTQSVSRVCFNVYPVKTQLIAYNVSQVITEMTLLLSASVKKASFLKIQPTFSVFRVSRGVQPVLWYKKTVLSVLQLQKQDRPL